MSTHARMQNHILYGFIQTSPMKVKMWLSVNRQVEAGGVIKSVGCAFEGTISTPALPRKGESIEMSVFTQGELDYDVEVLEVKYKLEKGVLTPEIRSSVEIPYQNGNKEKLEQQLNEELEYFKESVIPALKEQAFKQATKLLIHAS